jgi:hypothetical protein
MDSVGDEASDPSVAHRALSGHFDQVGLPVSAAADALRLVHGVLPAPREAADAGHRSGADDASDIPDAATVLSALTLLRELRDELTGWEPRLIDAARTLGVSWTQLAPALGVASRQAAERRYLRLRPAGPLESESTGDQRVLNERDRRAGERAVVEWARKHAGALRQIAARVADLGGSGVLDGQARDSVDRVQRTLGDNDTAVLVAPLIDAAHALSATHPDLARSISELLGPADSLRQDTRKRRAGQRT